MINKKKKNKGPLNLARKCGISEKNLKRVKTIDEIIESVPGMVLAQVLKNCTVTVGGRNLELKGGSVVVLPFDMFSQVLKTKDGEAVLKPYRKKFSEVFKRYRGESLEDKTLLIMRQGGLGDIMFIQPIVKYLRDKYPNSNILLATAPPRIPLLADWPKNLLNGVLTVPFAKEFLDAAHYHLSFEGAIERCDESFKVNYFDIFRRIAHLDYDFENYYPELIPNDFAMDTLRDVVIPPKTVMVHMKSSTPLKNLDLKVWKEIIDKLLVRGYNVGIIDAKDKFPVYEQFINFSKLDRTRVLNLSGYSLTVNYGIALLSKCCGLIGVDSSFTHFAGALNKPFVGIYGAFPGHLTVKHYKYAESVDPVNWNECGKYPCVLGPNQEFKCPYLSEKKELPGCINSIEPDRIIESFIRVMNKYEEENGKL